MPDSQNTPSSQSNTSPPVPAKVIPPQAKTPVYQKAALGCFVVFFGLILFVVLLIKIAPPAAHATSPSPAVSAQGVVTHIPSTSDVHPAAATDMPTLEKRYEEAKLSLRSAYSAHGRFQINGKIIRRTDDTLLIWGKALSGNFLVQPNSQGWMMDDGNIIVKNYEKEKIVFDQYLGYAVFLEQSDGKGNFGQSVPVNIYGQPPASVIQAEAVFNQADEALDQAKQGARVIEEAAQAAQAATEQAHGIHTVKAGESLQGIAKRELGDGSRFKEIAKLNNFDPTDSPKEGQVLKLPPREEPPTALQPLPIVDASLIKSATSPQSQNRLYANSYPASACHRSRDSCLHSHIHPIQWANGGDVQSSNDGP